MGMVSGTRKVIGAIFNFRVDKWIGLNALKEGSSSIMSTVKQTFSVAKVENSETFEQALIRLELTENDLKLRKKEFTKLLIFYLILSFVLFAYTLYLLFFTQNIGGSLITLALILYCLINAFRFHFWLFQIKKRKLGCSIKDWLQN